MKYIEKEVNDIDTEIWKKFLGMAEKTTIFHSLEWLQVISRTYSLKTSIRMLVGKDGIIGAIPLSKSLLRKKLVSLPYSDYGGPIMRASEDEREITRALLSDIVDAKINFEIRAPVLSDCFSQYSTYKKHILDISKKESTLMQQLNKKTIVYSIRKAQKNNISISITTSNHSLNIFYKLHLKTRKKHGVPPHPYSFFKSIKNYFLDQGNGWLLIAYFNEIPIAGGLFLTQNNTVYYKYNVSDIMFLKDKNPNHLLTWEAIRFFSGLGFKNFDFGRTFIGNNGLIRYKEMWGAKGYDLNYSYSKKCEPYLMENSIAMKEFSRLWKKMPEHAAKIIGPYLMKYIM